MGSAVVRSQHGFRVKCELDDWIGQHVFVTGSYEESTVEVVQAILGAGETAVDVGANIGLYSMLFSHLVGDSGRIIAFEPMPFAAARLREHVALNGLRNIDVRELAVGSRSGSCEFFIGPKHHTSISSVTPIAGAEQITVPCTTLDEALSDVGRVTLLKIDVEGAEADVLAGAQTVLDRGVPFVIAEINDRTVPELLCRRGFEMFWVDWNGLRPVPSPTEPKLPSQFNALFARQPLPARLRVLPAI
jgi:FkbM family methyltransferase